MNNRTNNLSIIQRIIAVILYISIFLAGCRLFSGNWQFLYNSGSEYNLLFVSGALLLIFGTYITEPYFTKPVDVITNSMAVILALLSINDPSKYVGYQQLFYGSVLLLFFSIVIVFLSQFPKIEKIQHLFFEIATAIGKSKHVFSVIYILTIVSYFKNEPFQFLFFLTFWIIFVTQYLVEALVVWISKIFDFMIHSKGGSDVIGEAIGCDNPFLYKVEVDFFKHRLKETKKGQLVYLSLDGSKGAIGIIINEKQLLNKKWITVYLLEEKNAPLKIDLRKHQFISGSKTIFSKDNTVYQFNIDDIEDEDSKKLIEQNLLYKNRERFIGYVAEGSDISKIRFLSLLDSSNGKHKLLREGTVVKTGIDQEDVLYQIIDGKTFEEELEKHNTYGYLTGIAQKLGKYNKSNNELSVVKWLPDIYSPIFFDETRVSRTSGLAIGRLPETNLEIVLKNVNELVTHNTAILGILGIGKSCLTFELIKKIVDNTHAKVVCIDITNEYAKELPNYIDGALLTNDLDPTVLSDLKTNNRNGSLDNPTSWGNESYYITKLDEELKKFDEDADKRVLILNPDWHSVSKAGSQFKITFKTDLTVAEKTRLISERLFVLAKKKWEENPDTQNLEAKYLLVFEEAHSLIPEWNSTANSNDQSASNGTAKVVLQGRKYGFGSLVVTQRTANISKSILNQCNTIFALRVFDDTGKQFLENYIGPDYSNTLPTLEERHAIAVGKALKLKQPVIIRLNNKDDIVIPHNE